MAVGSSERAKGRASRREAGDPPPLVEAKLQPPGAGGDQVKRSRILRRSTRGEGASLTLVAAPAGLRQDDRGARLVREPEGAFAWVTLDEGDNDPVRLWTYVATAVDRVRQGLGRGALQSLSVRGELHRTCRRRADERNRRVRHRTGSRARRPPDGDGPGVSCLDRLRAQASAGERAPDRRSRARIPRSSWRGCVPGAHSWNCAPTSWRSPPRRRTSCFVERGQVGARDRGDRAARQEHRGLAGCARPRRASGFGNVDDPGRAVSAFGGEQRFVVEYLSQEVLASLDDESRSFLQGASVLGRFTAELCDAVLERTDSASVLAGLERSNLFIRRLERGGWFRVHALFAEFAVAQLCGVEAGRGGTDPSTRRQVAVVPRAAGRGGRACRCSG